MEQIQRKTRRLELVLGPEDGGVKVDTLLRRRLHLSGTVIRRIKWLPDGILVDGARVNTAFRPREGQTLSVRLSDPERRSGILPAPGPLDIVYEDGDLLILNKAPGVPVHPSPGHFNDTIGNFLLNYYNSEELFPPHRGPKGDLQADGSGQAPTPRRELTGAFHRVHLAVLDGGPQPSGVVDAPLGPREGSLVEQMVRPDGKDARTRYETLSRSGGRSLVRLELDTGRTHQIRVHMASLGCPLTGDFLYGYEDRSLISRPALHSAQLSLRQPVTGQELSFTLPLPEDMARLLTHQKGEKEP